MMADVGLVNGDLPVYPEQIENLDLAMQRLETALQTYLGEWVLDTSVGMPFIEWLTTRRPDHVAIGAVILIEIRAVPGVLRVDNWTTSYTQSTSTFTASGDVVVEDGEVGTVLVEVIPPNVGNSVPVLSVVCCG